MHFSVLGCIKNAFLHCDECLRSFGYRSGMEEWRMWLSLQFVHNVLLYNVVHNEKQLVWECAKSEAFQYSFQSGEILLVPDLWISSRPLFNILKGVAMLNTKTERMWARQTNMSLSAVIPSLFSCRRPKIVLEHTRTKLEPVGADLKSVGPCCILLMTILGKLS